MILLAAAAVLAQSPDPISGGAGWVGAGLLGAVLAWLLLVHLPAKDKQLNDLLASQARKDGDALVHFDAVVDKKDKQIDQQRAEFTIALTTMTTAFRAEMTAERVATEGHFKALSETMTAALAQLGKQLSEHAHQAAQHSLRNQQWIDLLKKEVEERKAALAQKEGRSS